MKKLNALLSNKKLVTGFLVIAGIFLLLFPLLNFPQKALWVRIIGYAGLYIILGMGLLIHVGLAGMLDLGFAAFYAIGAYAYTFLASAHFGLHVSFWLAMPIAGVPGHRHPGFW
jgi:branched-chain amino acid transport system permease protein